VNKDVKMNRLQHGFSLISAIFLLVVLAGLGAAMVNFSNAQHQNLAMDVLGSRAYQAANAGIEWAAFSIETSAAASAPAADVFVPGSATQLGGNLAPFTVTVSFSSNPYVDAMVAASGVQPLWSHLIIASAVYGTAGNPDYVERVITAKLVR
jgi:MSHA biogenesis protein MshP